jgi:nucleotide-binding universal stress UspA family protein
LVAAWCVDRVFPDPPSRLEQDQLASSGIIYFPQGRRLSMAIKDVLLPLIGDSNESVRAAIYKCVAISGDLGARLSAVAIEQDVYVRPQVLISPDVDIAEVKGTLRSITDVQPLLNVLDGAAGSFGVRTEQQRCRLASTEIADHLARCARLKDLSLLPVKSHHSFSEKLVESLLFDSGRPVLLCPEESAADLSLVLDDVLIGWDGSAPAARAVGDALPILKSADNVRIVTATDDATLEEKQSGAALVDHLAERGIKATFETVKIDGSSVGKVLAAHVKANRIDLLVMGAYHHSRLNEIVWGGATKTIIGQPPCWVMMSR